MCHSSHHSLSRGGGVNGCCSLPRPHPRGLINTEQQRAKQRSRHSKNSNSVLASFFPSGGCISDQSVFCSEAFLTASCSDDRSVDQSSREAVLKEELSGLLSLSFLLVCLRDSEG